MNALNHLAILATTAALALAGSGPAGAAERVVTLGGSVTETVFALGLGDAVAARDGSSLYPPEAAELPEVGYYRNISAEGVLAQNPDLVLTTSEAGPPRALEQLRQAGVKLVVIEEKKTLEGAAEKISRIAGALDVPEKGAELREDLENRVARAREKIAAHPAKPRVLFLMQVDGAGSAMAAGKGTGVDEMLREAGAINAAAEITGYRDLSAEAVIAANPDIVLMPDHLFGAGQPVDRSALEPLLKGSNAWKNDRIALVDLGLLAGFGPRSGQALNQLAELLYPAAQSSRRDG